MIGVPVEVVAGASWVWWDFEERRLEEEEKTEEGEQREVWEVEAAAADLAGEGAGRGGGVKGV